MQDSIWLIGYRASGKSTLGRLLAEQLGWSFCDTDDELAKAEGAPVGEVFRKLGEAAFRVAENRVLLEVLERPGRWVVATGGGVLEIEANRRLLANQPKVVYLEASAELLRERLEGAGADAGGRPPLTSRGVLDEVAEVLGRRAPHYRAVAKRIVDGARPVPEIVEDLRRWAID